MTKLQKFQDLLDNDLGDTSKYDNYYISGLIGGNKPSTYSKSPAMWNSLFRQIGVKAVYFAFDYPPDGDIEKLFETAVEHGKFVNFNVTDPFKESLYKVLKDGKYDAEFSFEADLLNAVNHVLFDKKGKIYALNTDGAGLVRDINERAHGLAEKNVLLIGAGGAARSIAYALAKSKAKLTILNRTVEKAHKLAKLINEKEGTKIHSGGLDEIEEYALNSDIIIQAITKGEPIDKKLADKINNSTMFVDVRYGDKAGFKKLGEETNHPAIDGSGMVFWQFVIAAEKLGEINPEFLAKKEYFDKIGEEVFK